MMLPVKGRAIKGITINYMMPRKGRCVPLRTHLPVTWSQGMHVYDDILLTILRCPYVFKFIWFTKNYVR